MASDMAVEYPGVGRRAYDGVAQSFHWLIVGLVLIQYVTKLMPSGSAGMSEHQLDAWHVAIGPAILVLMLMRLAWRATHTPPPPPADLAPPLRLVSRLTHWAFYAILLILPMLGWVSLSGFGGRPTILGLIPLPALAAKDKAMAETWGDIHGALSWVLLALIGMHICGALYHVVVKKDDVMQRMLPGSHPGPV